MRPYLLLLPLLALGCAGGGSRPAATSGNLKIHHAAPEAMADEADRVRVVLKDSSGAEVARKDAWPIGEDAEIPNVSARAVRARFEYLRGDAVVGDAETPIDLTDGGEEVEVGGNPLGPVDHVRNDTGWTLTSGGVPVFFKGVGFDYTRLDKAPGGKWFRYIDPMIANLGANAIRTYGIPWTDGGVDTPGSPAYQAKDVSDLLAFAARNRMYLLVGVFVDGSATDARVQQFVTQIQNDPNFAYVLGWCVGNEVGEPNFPAVERLTKVVKAGMKPAAKVRPVMTALPAVSAGYVATINAKLPSLDMLGINVFYGCFDNGHCGGGYLNTQAQSLVSGGWRKPWAITEYYSYDNQAPDMPGQVLNGGNRYMLEANSTLNAQNYANSYRNYIASAAAKKAGSVGGFMLNFGPPHNSKLVASWLEPLTYTGEFTPFVNPPWNHGADAYYRLEAADAIAGLYGGSLGSGIPKIVLDSDNDPQGITASWKATLRSAGTKLAAGQTATASVKVSSASGVTFNWYIVGGNGADGYSGNITGPGTNPQSYIQPTTVFLGNGSSTSLGRGVVQGTISFRVPNTTYKNNYQLRVVAYDRNGGAATAAVGFAIR